MLILTNFVCFQNITFPVREGALYPRLRLGNGQNPIIKQKCIFNNYNPPQKSGPKGRRQKAGGFSASGPSGRIFEGGLKGNCKKKFIMEVKTVKTRKNTE